MRASEGILYLRSGQLWAALGSSSTLALLRRFYSWPTRVGYSAVASLNALLVSHASSTLRTWPVKLFEYVKMRFEPRHKMLLTMISYGRLAVSLIVFCLSQATCPLVAPLFPIWKI